LDAPTQAWHLDGEPFDSVILATAPVESARLLTGAAAHAPAPLAAALRAWADTASALRFEAITTVYAMAEDEPPTHRRRPRLPRPMLALRADARQPAQFVFDRGQLGDPAGLLAFVISASQGEREVLEAAVIAQAQQQLGLKVQPLQTITEKRATFACTPALQRPPLQIAPGLSACGDYCEGPYPATLEGAVRSGWSAAGDF
jgi:hypothetical protein